MDSFYKTCTNSKTGKTLIRSEWVKNKMAGQKESLCPQCKQARLRFYGIQVWGYKLGGGASALSGRSNEGKVSPLRKLTGSSAGPRPGFFVSKRTTAMQAGRRRRKRAETKRHATPFPLPHFRHNSSSLFFNTAFFGLFSS